MAQHLTCFIHIRRNLKDKLAECNIPVDLSQKILDDVFGKKLGSVFVEGIVDASDDSDFQNKLECCYTDLAQLQLAKHSQPGKVHFHGE